MSRIDPRNVLPGNIETRRLMLRAPIRGDVPQLVKLAGNSAVAEPVSLPTPYTRADGIGFVEIFAQRADERPYAITLPGIGLIGVVGFSFSTDEAPELGYWLGEPYWGQGIMSEATAGLLEAAHGTRQFPLIQAQALKSNAASLRVLEKAGFRRRGERNERSGNLRGRPMIVLEQRQ